MLNIVEVNIKSREKKEKKRGGNGEEEEGKNARFLSLQRTILVCLLSFKFFFFTLTDRNEQQSVFLLN